MGSLVSKKEDSIGRATFYPLPLDDHPLEEKPEGCDISISSLGGLLLFSNSPRDFIPGGRESEKRSKSPPALENSFITSSSPAGIKCPICFSRTKSDEVEKLLCGHSFCKNCIRAWLVLENTCPLCRSITDISKQ